MGYSDVVINFKLVYLLNKYILIGRINLILVKLWVKILFIWLECLFRLVFKFFGLKFNRVWLSLNIKGFKYYYVAI